VIRGTVDSLVKLVDTLAGAGIELIGEGATLERWRVGSDSPQRCASSR